MTVSETMNHLRQVLSDPEVLGKVERLVNELALELVTMRSQRDSWESGYYRELARRKELDKVVTALYEMLKECERKTDECESETNCGI